MPHKPAKLLQDVVDAAEAIQHFTVGKELDDLRRDLMLRSAVERQFEIIGEALKRLVNLDPDLASRLGDFSKIIAFRNIIAHGYDVLDPAIVWDVAKHDLPGLYERSRVVLTEIDGGA